jgi:hypothetical protein
LAAKTTESDRRQLRLQFAGLIMAGGLLALIGFACGGSKTPSTSPSPTPTPSPSTTTFTLDRATVVFPNNAAAGSTQTVTLTSTGSDPVIITSITVSGNFSETDDCGMPVESQATCTITVTFNPVEQGTGGTLTVTDASGSSFNAAVTGPEVLAPSGILVPSSLTFGSRRVGTTSAAQAVKLTNPVNGVSLPLSILGLTTTGDFAVAGNGCGASLPAGASCTITLTFTPSGPGSRSGYFAVVDNASAGMQSIPLSGTGQ